MKNSVSGSHWPHFKCSEATGGWWQPHQTTQRTFSCPAESSTRQPRHSLSGHGRARNSRCPLLACGWNPVLFIVESLHRAWQTRGTQKSLTELETFGDVLAPMLFTFCCLIRGRQFLKESGDNDSVSLCARSLSEIFPWYLGYPCKEEAVCPILQ